MNNEYNSNITIKKILLIIWKRFIYIFGVFLFAASSSLLIAKVSLHDSFSSSAAISSKKSIGPSLQQTICDVAKSGEIALKTYEKIEEEGVVGFTLNPAIIQNGVSTSFSQASYVIKINFSCSKESLCQIVLDTLVDITVDYCSGNNTPYNDLMNSLFVSDRASYPTKSTDKTFLYVVIGGVAGLTLSIAFFVSFDLIRDRFLTIDDVASLGVTTLVLKNYKNMFLFKKKNDGVFIDSKRVLCNSIDVLRDNNNNTTIGFFSIDNPVICKDTVLDIASFYSKNNRKTLCVDLNIHEDSLFFDGTAVSIFEGNGYYRKENDFLSFMYFKKQDYVNIANFKSLFSKIVKECSNQFDFLLLVFPPVQLYPDILAVGKELSGCFGCFKNDVDKRIVSFETIRMLDNNGISVRGCILIDKIK